MTFNSLYHMRFKKWDEVNLLSVDRGQSIPDKKKRIQDDRILSRLLFSVNFTIYCLFFHGLQVVVDLIYYLNTDFIDCHETALYTVM